MNDCLWTIHLDLGAFISLIVFSSLIIISLSMIRDLNILLNFPTERHAFGSCFFFFCQNSSKIINCCFFFSLVSPFYFENMCTPPTVRRTVSGYSLSVQKWVIIHFDCYRAEQDQPVFRVWEKKGIRILKQTPIMIPPIHKIICMMGGRQDRM